MLPTQNDMIRAHMEGLHSPEKQHKKIQDGFVLEDYSTDPIYPSLRKFDPELAERHLREIEDKEMSDENAIKFLEEKYRKRQEALEESEFSDENLDAALTPEEKGFFLRELETNIYRSADIGIGRTADVKRYDIDVDGMAVPMAIKYLKRPTDQTLTVKAEHDMLIEVERMQTIEQLEEGAHLEHFKVPHPYFHYKSEKLQCYGMEFINGFTLDEYFHDRVEDEQSRKLTESFLQLSENDILEEVDIFFAKMHKYCLHGDIKPGNIMVNSEEKFYLIDFGQSLLVNDISEKEMEQFETLKDDEIKLTKASIKHFFRRIRSQKDTSE